MAVASDQIDALGAAHEVHISTYRRDGTRRASIPIWVVRVGNELFARSAFGPEASWYRRAVEDNRLHLQVSGLELDTTLETIADDATNADVDAGYQAKYAGGGSALNTMVATPARETTVKLIVEEGK